VAADRRAGSCVRRPRRDLKNWRETSVAASLVNPNELVAMAIEIRSPQASNRVRAAYSTDGGDTFQGHTPFQAPNLAHSVDPTVVSDIDGRFFLGGLNGHYVFFVARKMPGQAIGPTLKIHERETDCTSLPPSPLMTCRDDKPLLAVGPGHGGWAARCT
jgi:hypothetical protein